MADGFLIEGSSVDRLLLEDGSGVYLLDGVPVTDFTSDVTTGTAPLTVQFTDTSTNTPTSWLWDFGDSTTSTSQNPSKVYSTAGTYTVSLTATNAVGSNTVTKTSLITVSSAGGGGGSPAFVKAWSAANTASSAVIVITVPTGGVTAGNKLIIGLNGSGVGTVNTVVDTRGNTYTIDRNSTGTTGGQFVSGQIATALVAGDTITVTGSTSLSGRVATVMEFSGLVSDATAFDIELSSTGTSTAADSGVSPTTTQANELVVGWINPGNASTTTLTSFDSSYTKAVAVDSAQATARSQVAFYKFVSSIGTQSITGTLNASMAWRAMVATYKVGSGGGGGPVVITPTVDYRMVGADGRVKFKTNNTTSVRIKYGTDTAVTQNVVFTSAATPNALGIAEIALPENASTDLYYRIAMTDSGGTEVLDTKTVVGKVPMLTASFGANFSSCCDATDSGALPNIRARSDAFFFHLGDMWYDDTAAQDVASYRTHMLAKLMAANHEPLFATTRVLYTASDHDVSMRNNGNGTSYPTAIANFNQVYRELIPTPTLPSATEYYYSYRVPNTNVLLVNLDCRTGMTTIGAAESSSKRVIGATQETWLTNLIDATDAKEIWLLGDTPWVGTALASDDAWLGYDTQRQRLATYFTSKQPGKQFRYFAGDMHALAVGVGPGNVTNYQASPLNNSASVKADGWAMGPYPASGTAVVEQYARVVLTMTGSDYTIVYNGYSGDNTLRVGPHTTSVTGTVVRQGWYALIGNVEVPVTIRNGA